MSVSHDRGRPHSAVAARSHSFSEAQPGSPRSERRPPPVPPPKRYHANGTAHHQRSVSDLPDEDPDAPPLPPPPLGERRYHTAELPRGHHAAKSGDATRRRTPPPPVSLNSPQKPQNFCRLHSKGPPAVKLRPPLREAPQVPTSPSPERLVTQSSTLPPPSPQFTTAPNSKLPPPPPQITASPNSKLPPPPPQITTTPNSKLPPHSPQMTVTQSSSLTSPHAAVRQSSLPSPVLPPATPEEPVYAKPNKKRSQSMRTEKTEKGVVRRESQTSPSTTAPGRQSMHELQRSPQFSTQPLTQPLTQSLTQPTTQPLTQSFTQPVATHHNTQSSSQPLAQTSSQASTRGANPQEPLYSNIQSVQEPLYSMPNKRRSPESPKTTTLSPGPLTTVSPLVSPPIPEPFYSVPDKRSSSELKSVKPASPGPPLMTVVNTKAASAGNGKCGNQEPLYSLPNKKSSPSSKTPETPVSSPSPDTSIKTPSPVEPFYSLPNKRLSESRKEKSPSPSPESPQPLGYIDMQEPLYSLPNKRLSAARMEKSPSPGPAGSVESGSPASASRHIPVTTWLGALDLMEYQELFKDFSGVEDLVSLSEADLRDLGVRNHAHRAHMVSTLTLYRDKLNKKMNRAPPKYNTSPRPGAGSLTPPKYSHPDYATVQGMPGASPSASSNMAYALFAKLRDQPTVKELAKYAWYHGGIPRQKAEQLTVRDGDFLVRDSVSKPGDFVLTACCRGAPLHFVINKRLSGPTPGGASVVEYQFEEDAFEKPTDLILFYLESGRSITQMSQAVIRTPVIRAVPLEYYDPKPPPQAKVSPRASPWGSPASSPQVSPLVQRKVGRPHRAGSQPLLSLDDGSDSPQGGLARKGSMPLILNNKLSTPPPSSTNNNMPLPPSGLSHRHSSPKQERHLPQPQRTGSDPSLALTDRASPQPQVLKPSGSDESISKPPPKPSRVPTLKKEKRPNVQIRNKNLYDDDGHDYSDYDQIKSWPAALERSQREAMERSGQTAEEILRLNRSMYDVPKNARNAQVVYDTPKSLRTSDTPPTEVVHRPHTVPKLHATTSFNLTQYDSQILTPGNKPLENSAVTTIKSLLLDSQPKVMAQHITHLDLKLLKVSGFHDLGLGVTSGLELISLPQGRRLRQDLIDRYQCMSLFVAVTILLCAHPSDRAQMLHQWIQIAIELRGAMGNMFSFSAVMRGILSRQITRLTNTWILLRQRYSETAFMYEQRLRGLNHSLDNASATLPLQNITIPHIMPLVMLLERDFTDIEALTPWESERADFGLDTVLTHLDTIRVVTQQCGLYRVTAENVLRDFELRRDLADVFHTEMHLRLMWGARGAGVNMNERLTKFPVVLDVLSTRAEPGPDHASESAL